MNNRTIISNLLASFSTFAEPTFPGVESNFHVRASSAGSKGGWGTYVHVAVVEAHPGKFSGRIENTKNQKIRYVARKVHSGSTSRCESAYYLRQHRAAALLLAQEEWTNALAETTFGLNLHPFGGVR